MNTVRYTRPAMLLHWLMAVFIGWLFWLGWTMTELPKGAERSAAYGLHKSLGLLVLALVVVRLAWRHRHQPPAAAGHGWQERLAGAVHAGLYLFMLLAPLAGYLASAFTPYATRFFGLELPRLGAADAGLNAAFKQVHVVVVWGGAALLVLHLGGALLHAVRRDGTLQRMLPGRLFKN